MANMALSAEYLLPIERPAFRPAAHSASKRAISWHWQAIGDIAASILFLGVLGWEMWHIASHLLAYAVYVAAGSGTLF